jgi:hypothetical protein
MTDRTEDQMSKIVTPTLKRPTLDRRTVLRGSAAVLGLPLLEAMTPMARSAYASPDTLKRPVRMACVFFPNGAIMPKWKPTPGPSGKPND